MRELATIIVTLLEGAGPLTVAGGSAIALIVAASRLLKHLPPDDVYRGVRVHLGRAILLGLELLVAADILRTITLNLTFRSVAVLASIVAIRTFLSFTLEVETTGRWPWQHKRD